MKKRQKKLVKGLVLIVAVLIVLSMLLPAYQVKNSDQTFKGFELAFGKELANFMGYAKAKLPFNILMTLAYLLPIIGGLILAYDKKLSVVTALLFLVAGVLFILAPNTFKVTYELLGSTTSIDLSTTYTVGSIISAVLSFVGVLLSGYYFLK